MTYKLNPPFEIYHDGIEISDRDGHLCTAENKEIAKAIIAALELANLLKPSLAVTSQERQA